MHIFATENFCATHPPITTIHTTQSESSRPVGGVEVFGLRDAVWKREAQARFEELLDVRATDILSFVNLHDAEDLWVESFTQINITLLILEEPRDVRG